MASIDVSIESLKTVKSALKFFQDSIAGFSGRISSYTLDSLSICQNAMKETSEQISQLESRITALKNKISTFESQIVQATNEKSRLEQKLPSLENQLSMTEQRIRSLQERLDQLYAALSKADDEQKSAIQQQIQETQNQLMLEQRKQSDLQAEISQTRRQISELNNTISNLKTEKMRCENELNQKTNRLNKLLSKFERMKTTFATVKDEINQLNSTAKSFETDSSETARREKDNVEKCISSIDEYLSVHLSSMSGTNGSGVSSMSSSLIATGSNNSAPLSSQVLLCAAGEYHYSSTSNNSLRAYGQLHIVPMDRRVRSSSSQVSAGGEARRFDDHGGHLIGAIFGGAPTSENLFPQNRRLNTRGYRQLEREWVLQLENENLVFVDIHVSASNDVNRQDSIYGTYIVVHQDGRTETTGFSFANEDRDTQQDWNNTLDFASSDAPLSEEQSEIGIEDSDML